MTAEEKRDRRAARHEVQRALRPVAKRQSLTFGFSAAKERVMIKTLADRFFKEQVTPAAKRIESEVIAEAKRRYAEAS